MYFVYSALIYLFVILLYMDFSFSLIIVCWVHPLGEAGAMLKYLPGQAMVHLC